MKKLRQQSKTFIWKQSVNTIFTCGVTKDENVIVPTQCGPQGEGIALGGPSVVCDFRSPQQIAWPSEVSPMPVFLNPATPLLRTGPRGELHQWVRCVLPHRGDDVP